MKLASVSLLAVLVATPAFAGGSHQTPPPPTPAPQGVPQNINVHPNVNVNPTVNVRPDIRVNNRVVNRVNNTVSARARQDQAQRQRQNQTQSQQAYGGGGGNATNGGINNRVQAAASSAIAPSMVAGMCQHSQSFGAQVVGFGASTGWTRLDEICWLYTMGEKQAALYALSELSPVANRALRAIYYGGNGGEYGQVIRAKN